jgi:Predicted permeases
MLPILVMIALGYACRRMRIISRDGILGIKKLVTDILLPVVLFNALSTVHYSLDSLTVFLVILGCTGLELLIGFFIIRRFMGEYQTFTPFLIAGSEVGLLGYALFALLAGEKNICYLASLDLGNALFLNTVSITLLAVESGKKTSVKNTARQLLKVPAFAATLLGVLAGVSGVSSAFLVGPAGGIYTSLVSFLTTPVSALVLFCVGYELTMNVSILKPAVKAVGFRILLSACMLFLVYRIIFLRGFPDPAFIMALVLFFALPPSMIIPMYTKKDSDNQFTSTALSLYLIVTITVFAVLTYQKLSIS